MKKTNIILSTIAMLSLILCSACSRTEEPPFKVGDSIREPFPEVLHVNPAVVLEIKGKWFRARTFEASDSSGKWYNSDLMKCFFVEK